MGNFRPLHMATRPSNRGLSLAVSSSPLHDRFPRSGARRLWCCGVTSGAFFSGIGGLNHFCFTGTLFKLNQAISIVVNIASW
jgi:hypothetical protein